MLSGRAYPRYVYTTADNFREKVVDTAPFLRTQMHATAYFSDNKSVSKAIRYIQRRLGQVVS